MEGGWDNPAAGFGGFASSTNPYFANFASPAAQAAVAANPNSIVTMGDSGGYYTYDNYTGPDGNGGPVYGQTPWTGFDASGKQTSSGVMQKDNPAQMLMLAALAAGGMAFGLPGLVGSEAAGVGGVSGAAFGDAGLMYAGADAAAAGALGGGAGVLGGAALPVAASTVAPAATSGVLSSLGGWGGLIAPAASIAAGLIGANAAGNAADKQIAAGDRATAAQMEMFNRVQGLLAPYVAAGTGNLANYQNLAGSNGAGAQRAAIDALVAGPEFAHLIKQGENAILQNASATGGLRGGNVQAGLANFRADQTAQLIDRQLGRYGGLIQLGQNSAVGVGNAGMQTGARIGDIAMGQGSAQAGSVLAGANAIGNAIGTVGGIYDARMAQEQGRNFAREMATLTGRAF